MLTVRQQWRKLYSGARFIKHASTAEGRKYLQHYTAIRLDELETRLGRTIPGLIDLIYPA